MLLHQGIFIKKEIPCSPITDYLYNRDTILLPSWSTFKKDNILEHLQPQGTDNGAIIVF